MYLGVLTPTKRPRIIEAEVRGQRLVDTEAGDLKPRSLRSGSQRDQIQSLNQEILGHKART